MGFFTRALDKITPWRRPGEVQRDLQTKKKKKNEDENQTATPGGLRVGVAQPNQNIQVGNQPQQPKPQRPENLFQGLQNNLKIGQSQNPILESSNPDLKPKPVVTPTLKVTPTSQKQDIILPNGQKSSDIPDTPEQTLNKELDKGKSFEDIARDNNFDLDKVREYATATRPNYGIKEIARPKQGIGNRFRDIFDTNTQSDIYRRQQGNKVAIPTDQKPVIQRDTGNIVSRTPIVGHVTKMLNTAGAQIPELSITADSMIQTKMWGDLQKQLAIAKQQGNSFQVNEINRKLDQLSAAMDQTKREEDAAHTMFKKNSGGLFNAGTLYGEEASREGKASDAIKDIALPTATTMLDIYTLGQGSAVSEGLKEAIPRVGFKQALRTVAPNLARAGAGNFASGAGNVYAEGGNTGQALKAGTINAVLGTVPDVALPAAFQSVRSRVLPKIFNGRFVKPADIIQEGEDAALAGGAETANRAVTPRPISVAQDVPVDAVEGLSQPIRVRNLNEPQRLIREIGGDATTATPDALIKNTAEEARAQALRDAAFDQAKTAGRPDPAIEGVTPRTNESFKMAPEDIKKAQDVVVEQYATMLRDLGEGNGVDLVPDAEGGYGKVRASNNYRPGMGSGKITKAGWREEAERQLRSGKAESGAQKAFDDAANPEVQSMLAKGEQVPVGEGRPIQVKQVTGIPVTDESVVPTNLPETPGTVRATTAAAPSNAKSEAIANSPVVNAPAQLPADVQEILDNPKQFNKRQVAAARNQRKMARAVAKANEDTAAAMDRIQTASPAATSGEGFSPTGEFARSQNGGMYQKASRAAEMQQAVQETAQMSPDDVIKSARAGQAETGSFTRRDIRNIAAMFETKRIPRGSELWNEARQILKEDGTQWGQVGALRNYTMRRTATADQLMSRYESKIYRLADDPSKIDGKLLDEVEVVENAYTQARDDALAAYNNFTKEPTSANAKIYHAAQDAAEKADKAAKTTEYKVADKVLKGNKDVKQVRELEKMQSEAGLYQMDAVDASMLSGTGTFVRNFVNAGLGGSEEGLFGGLASRVTRKITGQEVGGGFGKGTLSGFKGGVRDLREASSARASNAGWNPLGHIKNYATTGNELGDTIIDSQVRHNVLDHYTQMLKEQGYKGRELADRASVMARQDPDELSAKYLGFARSAAGLGGGITRANKVETLMKNAISDGMTSMGVPRAVADNVGKLTTRMTIGFPTAIARSTKEGIKRFTLGTPTFIKALATKDPLERALLIKEGIKQAGTGGLVIPPLFYAMGANDMITGAYPDDPEERARWQREGISENSIKIGGNYYQLPGYLGSWAVPSLFYASLGRNGGDFKQAAADTAKIIPSILPTDNISNWMDVINGDRDFGKFMAQTGASAVRASTPGGAALAELAKMFDGTKNDTNSGTNLENFVDKVMTGIPGASNTVPNQESDNGDVIQNPNPVPLVFGASSAVQGAGEDKTAQMQAQVDSSVKNLQDIGVLDDANLKGVLDEKEQKIYNDLKAGKKLKDGDIKKLQEAFIKGVSSTGDDTAYLEREQYDTNLSVLNLKKQLMEADKTTKPSDIKKMDTAIKRGQIYKDGNIPYDMINAYQSTSVDEWRDMGDPESDSYDPDMYQKLWNLDQTMTKGGVSYKTGALDKNKYYVKEKKAGGKGSRGGYSSDFGTLKAGGFAPSVQNYQTIDQASGNIPIIHTVRPNIVHKIGSSG